MCGLTLDSALHAWVSVISIQGQVCTTLFIQILLTYLSGDYSPEQEFSALSLHPSFLLERRIVSWPPLSKLAQSM